jgi:hypothetical protein
MVACQTFIPDYSSSFVAVPIRQSEQQPRSEDRGCHEEVTNFQMQRKDANRDFLEFSNYISGACRIRSGQMLQSITNRMILS